MNTATATALAMRDEVLGSTFYGKGAKALGTVEAVRYLTSLNAKGRRVQRGVEFTLQTDTGLQYREYRLNDRLRYER